MSVRFCQSKRVAVLSKKSLRRDPYLAGMQLKIVFAILLAAPLLYAVFEFPSIEILMIEVNNLSN